MKHKAQASIELTVVMVGIFLLCIGMIKIFRWVGMDLSERRLEHEKVLTAGADVTKQLSPDFYRPKRLNATVKR